MAGACGVCVCVRVTRDAAAKVPLRRLQKSPARSHQRHVSAVILSESERSREEPAGRRRPEVAARAARGQVTGARSQGRGEFAKVRHNSVSGSISHGTMRSCH